MHHIALYTGMSSTKKPCACYLSPPQQTWNIFFLIYKQHRTCTTRLGKQSVDNTNQSQLKNVAVSCNIERTNYIAFIVHTNSQVHRHHLTSRFWLKASSCDLGGQPYTKVKPIRNHLSKSLQRFDCYNLATIVVISYIKGYDWHWLLLSGK